MNCPRIRASRATESHHRQQGAEMAAEGQVWRVFGFLRSGSVELGWTCTDDLGSAKHNVSLSYFPKFMEFSIRGKY